MSDTFPRQYARTRRFTLGEPRTVSVSADGERVVFLRSRGGDDPVNCLWAIDLRDGEQRLIADPNALLGAPDDDLPASERSRRERQREAGGGITSYALDRTSTRAVFALAGRLFVADLTDGTTRNIDIDLPAFDPRLEPAGQMIAYVSGRELRISDPAGHTRTIAAEPDDDPDVTWGSADFIAAEEMHRFRGFWWAPDGTALAVCRVDESLVHTWHISNPAEPGSEPTVVRYPVAGTPNPDVTLHLFPVVGDDPIAVDWDRGKFPYLAAVDWSTHGLAITVQSRDQRDLRVLEVDVADGHTSTIWADRDEHWVELVPGAGRLVGAGVLVTCADRDGARRLVVADEVVSPPDVQVRSIVSATFDRVVVVGNPVSDATVQHVYRWTPDAFEQLTDETGIHTAVAGGATVVTRSATLGRPGAVWTLPGGGTIGSLAEDPLVTPNVALLRAAPDEIATAVLTPHDHDGSPLPVLLDPYGGPHAQRVIRSANAFCPSQWFADQGFAVVVADGRGTPGRGTDFERAVHHDLAGGVLDDQIAALHHAAAEHPALDLDRVAIRGWSFGGYLAALAVLRRPDVFHAAIAGAPVTEWRLYDTHYTERYLGDPNEAPDVYEANSLLPLAPGLHRPLLLVHGLADDNVVAAHSLRLSSALLAAGRPHEVLPLVGVTHMTPQEIVAENLLLHQLDFLRRALGLTTVQGDE